MKFQTNPVLLENIRTQERWVCDDISRIKIIDNVDFLYIHPVNSLRVVLMRRDSLRRVNK